MFGVPIFSLSAAQVWKEKLSSNSYSFEGIYKAGSLDVRRVWKCSMGGCLVWVRMLPKGLHERPHKLFLCLCSVPG